MTLGDASFLGPDSTITHSVHEYNVSALTNCWIDISTPDIVEVEEKFKFANLVTGGFSVIRAGMSCLIFDERVFCK